MAANAKKKAPTAKPIILQADALDTIARAANLSFSAASKMESLMEPKNLQGLTRRVKISIYDGDGKLVARESKDFNAEDNLAVEIDGDVVTATIRKFPNAASA